MFKTRLLYPIKEVSREEPESEEEEETEEEEEEEETEEEETEEEETEEEDVEDEELYDYSDSEDVVVEKLPEMSKEYSNYLKSVAGL